MAFQQFTFPQVLTDLGLTVLDVDLFGDLASETVSPEFDANIREGTDLATAIHNEKARSEFMIAPVLLELRRRHRGEFSLFSGVELNADPNRGLNGICDFALAQPRSQHVMIFPILSIVEAKTDNLRSGLGQCISSMVAAAMINDPSGESLRPVYGVVTSGSLWKFLKLSGSEVWIDKSEYLISDLGKLLAILGSIVTSFRK